MSGSNHITRPAAMSTVGLSAGSVWRRPRPPRPRRPCLARPDLVRSTDTPPSKWSTNRSVL